MSLKPVFGDELGKQLVHDLLVQNQALQAEIQRLTASAESGTATGSAEASTWSKVSEEEPRTPREGTSRAVARFTPQGARVPDGSPGVQEQPPPPMWGLEYYEVQEMDKKTRARDAREPEQSYPSGILHVASGRDGNVGAGPGECAEHADDELDGEDNGTNYDTNTRWQRSSKQQRRKRWRSVITRQRIRSSEDTKPKREWAREETMQVLCHGDGLSLWEELQSSP